jgi:hypothetical protein
MNGGGANSRAPATVSAFPDSSTPHRLANVVTQPNLSRTKSSPTTGRKRKLSALNGQSPESMTGEGWDNECRIGVKRACNECRQQKVSQYDWRHAIFGNIRVWLGSLRMGMMYSLDAMSFKIHIVCAHAAKNVALCAASTRTSSALASGS